MTAQAEAFGDSHAREAWDAGADAWLTFVRSGAAYYRLRVYFLIFDLVKR
ncbi:MAG: hypothetical protein ACREMQ_13250 [Longimicrobiales bacterium]